MYVDQTQSNPPCPRLKFAADVNKFRTLLVYFTHVISKDYHWWFYGLFIKFYLFKTELEFFSGGDNTWIIFLLGECQNYLPPLMYGSRKYPETPYLQIKVNSNTQLNFF